MQSMDKEGIMFEFLEKRKKGRFLNKLSFILWVCIFIPFCIAIITYSVSISHTKKNDIKNTYRDNLSVFCSNFDKLLSSSTKKFDFLFNYTPLTQTLNITEEQTTLDKVNTAHDLGLIFEALLSDTNYMKLKIYTDNDKLYVPKYIFHMDRLSELPFCDEVQNLEKSDTLYTIHFQNEYMLCIYRKYNRVNQGFAVIALEIPCSQISKLIEENNLVGTELFMKYNDTIYNMNTFEAVDSLPEDSSGFNNHIQENNSTIYMYAKDNAYRHIYIYTVLCAMIAISLLAVILILLSKSIAWLLSKKLYEITDIIKDDELQNLNTEKIDNDEFGIILSKLLDFYNELKEKAEREKEIDKKLAQLEINILQERISPHFLYNTLASIKWSYPDKRLGEIIDSIVHYYRLMLNSGSSITTIENELNGIIEYLKIQSFAYAKEVEVVIHCDDKLKKHEIIKTILQPIVENAFLHGVNLSEEHGKISITVSDTDENIIFCVTNTGPVISPEKIQEINNLSVHEYNNHSRLGYALKNIVNRMNIYYGPGFGITAAVENELTSFYIKIPKNFSAQMPKEETKQ